MIPKVKIAMTPPLDKWAKRKRQQLKPAIEKALDHVALDGVTFAKRATPVDTGRLRASITWRQIGFYSREIGTNVRYAPFILGDVGPFIIRVKNAKALAWIIHRGGRSKSIRPNTAAGWRALRKQGKVAYAKWVRHPGGKRIFIQTAKHLARRAPAIVGRILKAGGF